MAAPQEIQAFQQIWGSSSSHPPLRPTHLSEAVGKGGGHGQGWDPPGAKPASWRSRVSGRLLGKRPSFEAVASFRGVDTCTVTHFKPST